MGKTKCRSARLEALTDGAEVDARPAMEVRVPVCVYRGRGAVDAELLVCVHREVAARRAPDSHAPCVHEFPRPLRARAPETTKVSA